MQSDRLFNLHVHLSREGYKPTPVRGNRFACSCPLPGHGKGRGDRNPSLSVYQTADGIVHFKCHAGCDPLQITEYLGLKPVDLGYGTDTSQNIVYDYHSPEGTLLYQVVRKPGKEFRQRRPDPDTPDGGWIWNLKGTEPVPYNLRGILRGDDPILIVEGEKDANTLIDRGYVATTNSGGAGKWPDTLNKYFRDRLVYVLCDNDEPGRRHQQQVASALVTVAEKVVVVPPFEDAKDVTEWFLLGHNDREFADWLNRGEERSGVILNKAQRREESPASQPADDPEILHKNVQDDTLAKKPGSHDDPGQPDTLDTTADSLAPSVLDFHRIRGDALLAKDLPEPRWIVPGLLSEGLAFLAGKPKSGKSWIALEIGMAVATGECALGLSRCERGSVLILSLEDSERRVQDRMRTLGGATLAEADVSRMDIVVAHALTLAQFDWWLRHRGDARLVIIDTFGRWRDPQEKNTSLYDHDTQTASALQKLALKHHVCILLIHHTRKAVDDNDPLVEISGSFGLSGAADTLLVMRRKRGHDLAELFVTGRDIDEARHRMEFKRDADSDNPLRHTGWQITGELEEDERDMLEGKRRRIVETLEMEGKPMTNADIAASVGINKSYLSQLLPKMRREGLVVNVKRGVWGLPKQLN
ncbi:AAA family ATPase [bacterium]|nr:AAA family ATPase [bacterium]